MKKLVAFGFITGLLLVPAVAVQAADPFEELCNQTPSAEVCQNRGQEQNRTTNSIYGREGIITKVTQLMVFIIGIASVLVIIVGGLQYVMSTGDPSKTAKAKDTILFALIGVAVAVMAQTIVVFVLSKL